MATDFTQKVIKLIGQIPPGQVTTYGMIAAGAGNPSGARQVSRILHSSSRKYNLPWHRVINRQGRISLPPGRGFEMQRDLLQSEGVNVCAGGKIDLERYLWLPHEASDTEKSPSTP